MKMIHNWGIMPYKERTLKNVLDNIREKCNKYNISKTVIDRA